MVYPQSSGNGATKKRTEQLLMRVKSHVESKTQSSTTKNSRRTWLMALAEQPADHRPRSGHFVVDGAHRPRKHQNRPKKMVDGHQLPDGRC